MHRIPKHKRFSSRLAVTVAQSNEARCSVENEDVVGAAPTGDAPTTSEWSTILLPTKVRLILETWRYTRPQFGHHYVCRCQQAQCWLIGYVSWWRHQIETFFRVTGPLNGEFTGHRWIPHTKASDAELWCLLWSAPWINGWINNREAGGLKRHRAHHDVIVMFLPSSFGSLWLRIAYCDQMTSFVMTDEIPLYLAALSRQVQCQRW